jgi:DNA polymerase-3 subunit gamma/tau
MSYVVLARKWRPQQFSDVLGQEHVTQTLTNAIAARRIAHAFLFSGPRGVGKTSAARILSKALCCEAEGGPTAQPCGVCRACTEITEGRSTDVFEIDAASHTGVDNVRDIIENARYLPSSARFKIYVIDEVHMLTLNAFNALLKTLEEPPGHVKFILATTDVHKVPVTVKSRCQRYDFRRIPLSRIAERLSFILQEEGIHHDPSSLSVVARESEGSMRDAQSLLEQVLAYAGARPLDAPLVREALGVVDSALVDRAREAFFQRQPGALIELVGDVHARGLDLNRFVSALIEHVRDLLAARLVADPKGVLDRPADELQALVEEGRRVGPEALERLFEQLCRVAEDVGRSSHPRFALEIGLASIAEKPPQVPLAHLVAQLDRVEDLLGAAPRAPRPGPGSRGPSGPPPGGPSGRGGHGRGPEPAAVPRPAAPPRAAARGREPGGGSPARAPSADDDAAPEPPPAPAPPPTASGGPARTPAPPYDPDEPPPPTERWGPPSREAPDDDGPPPLGDLPAERAAGRSRAERGGPGLPGPGPQDPPVPTGPVWDAAPPDPPGQPKVDLQDLPKGPAWLRLDDAFARFVAEVRRRRPALAATLVQVRPLVFDAEQVLLGCETAFDQGKLNDRETHEVLAAFLAEHFGGPVRLTVQRGFEVAAAATKRTLAEVDDAHQAAVRVAKEQAARDNPAVRAVVTTLGGAIANVRILDEG